jgi:hypothetical protein
MADEIPLRVPARRGFSLSYRGKTLLSTRDPVALAENAVAALAKTRGPTLYFCPSPLYGYGLSLLLESIGEDSAVLCVEADAKLLELSNETIDSPVLTNPRLLLASADDGAELCALVRKTWGSRRFRRVERLRLSGGWQLNPALYDALEDTLRREISLDWGNAMTLTKLGRRYARNALRNLALIPRCPPLLALDFGSAPVLVLGAGPSLDSFLDRLALSEKGRFKIVCVDTALSVLHARGIKPDLVVALESQHWNLRDFVGLGCWEIPVAMDLSALGATGEMLGGRPRLFFTPWTRLSLFGRLRSARLLPEEFPPMGSVGLSAVAIALRLSTGPIILAGMDFSFTLDRTHARSAPAHLAKLRSQTRFCSPIDPEAAFRKGCHPALSKTGEPVRTSQAMKNYRDLFQREFAEISPKGSERRILDLAGPGLDLGLETLPVETACAILAGDPGDGTAGRSATTASAETEAAVEAVDGAAALAATKAAAILTADFIKAEIAGLKQLRGILTGENKAGGEQLGALLDRCDYLWAHFPDCAGADGRRPAETDLGFLKRVRAEIDPFAAILERALKHIPC